MAAKANGKKGGQATAKKHGPEFCQARAQKAGLMLKARYGVGYFKYIGQMRRATKGGWPKGKPRKKLDIVLPTITTAAAEATI